MQTLWNMNPICSGCEEGEDSRLLVPKMRSSKQVHNGASPDMPKPNREISEFRSPSYGLHITSLTDQKPEAQISSPQIHSLPLPTSDPKAPHTQLSPQDSVFAGTPICPRTSWETPVCSPSRILSAWRILQANMSSPLATQECLPRGSAFDHT